MTLVEGNTVLEEASLAFDYVQQLESELESVNQQMAERTDYESKEYHDLIERSVYLNEQFMMSGGGNFWQK